MARLARTAVRPDASRAARTGCRREARGRPRICARFRPRRAGDKYVKVVGASVAAQCLAAGVLDEILAFSHVVLLGNGTRLFDHPDGQTVRLEQISVTCTPQVTNLWFRVCDTGKLA